MKGLIKVPDIFGAGITQGGWAAYRTMQQQMQNHWTNYTATSNSAQFYLKPGLSLEAPDDSPKKESALAWLDRRVAELRVRL